MGLLGFLVAALYVPYVPSATEVGRWGAMAVGAALLVAREVMRRGGSQEAHIATPSAHLGLIFIAWCALGLLWSFSPWDTAGALLHLAILASVFYVSASSEKVDDALTGFSLGITVSSLFSILQWLGLHPVFSIQAEPAGLFLTKNAAAEAAVPIAVWAALTRRWWALLPALITIMPSGAREAWLMFAGSATYLLMRWAYRRGGRRQALTMLSMVLSGAALAVVAVATWPEAVTVSLNERLEIWQVALAAWWVRPWGWGLNSFGSMFINYGFAHNDYIQLLVETGPGVVALLVLLSRAMVGNGSFVEKSVLASLLASAFVWWPLQQPASAFLVALLCGRLCSVSVRGVQLVRGDRRRAGAGISRHAASDLRPARTYR